LNLFFDGKSIKKDEIAVKEKKGGTVADRSEFLKGAAAWAADGP
jgi:hypothetical protein